jgi:WD40 repeat protein
VWDLKNPDPAAPPLVLRGHEVWGHEVWISALAFAPDGRLVTGSEDKTARVWSLNPDQLIQMAGGVASRNLTYSEWQRFFGQEPYRRTFSDLPDGAGVAEARQAQPAARSGTPPATPPAARPH